MPPVTFPGLMRVTFVWTRPADDEVVNTFHCPSLDVVSLPNLQGWAEDMYAWLSETANPWRDLYFNQFGLSRVIAYDLNPGSSMAGEASGSVMGSNSGAPSIHQAAAVITWLTQRRGAQYRGRTYVGPLRQSWVDTGGLITQAGRDAIIAAAGALVGQFAVQGTPMQVASFTHNTTEPIIGAAVDNSPDVQRRRARKATARSQTIFAG